MRHYCCLVEAFFFCFICFAIAPVYSFEPLPLPYAYDVLEPWISAEIMELHSTKHHAAYARNLKAALQRDAPALLKSDIQWLVTHTDEVPSSIQQAVRNNAGGVYNHDFFWTILRPGGGQSRPPKKLLDKIEATFGTFDAFQGNFTEKALSVFGSGWAWLVVEGWKDLRIVTSSNQDNPIMLKSEKPLMPILGCDVWEHAYYLQYKNDRGKYVQAFFSVVNWDVVNEYFFAALTPPEDAKEEL
mmetsp:Transcript_17145/g.28206  ORF Transcript_17145/g.28206 Transcript_17145/m.28206 type:complete len:243 (+) Transcript_17145:111-839(+)